MCGFYGYIGPSINQSNIDLVSNAIHHRGPDDSGLEFGDSFLLGFRRLSILDLSQAGHQPMVSADGRYKLVFNGEIYNYFELKRYLSDNDLPLKGNSDTEVLFKLLIKKGVETLPLLNGMFSFVFIDLFLNEYIIARDRLGVKPLYYALFNKVLYFASELPSLLFFGLEKKISSVGLNQYIRFGQIAPPLTIYENIYKLKPGHYIKGCLSETSNVIQVSWWDLPLDENFNNSEETWLREIDDLLFDATKIRLVSDVPVGIFLSGGIDSSLIAHYASKQDAYSKPIALCVKFSNSEFDEYEFANLIAESKGLKLFPIDVNASGLNEIHVATNNVGEPFTDSSIINQFFLSKAAKKYATVFLTGDGGDEAFAGYNEYLFCNRFKSVFPFLIPVAQFATRNLGFLLMDDNNLKQQISKLSVGNKYFGTAVRINYQEPLLKSLLKKEHLLNDVDILKDVWESWDRTKGLSLIKRLQVFDYKNYLEPDVLVKVDRATMANSIESRSPFLDYRIVELAMKIPTHYNINNGLGKQLLRKLVKKHLPDKLSGLPKKGFGLPYRNWLTIERKKELISLSRLNDHGFWDNEVFLKIVENADSLRYDYYSIFWRIWMFEIWYSKSYLNDTKNF
jgi:asparagine synthase (glutamine-hydrolysing)